jgi:hypothetical protein
MGLFRSKSDTSSSDTVAALHAQAAADYATAQDPNRQAAAREQLGQARANGNAAAASRTTDTSRGRWRS